MSNAYVRCVFASSVAVVLTLSGVTSASANDANESLWAKTQVPDIADSGNTMAKGGGYRLSVGVVPGFDVHREGSDNAYGRGEGFVSGAYRRVYEVPSTGYGIRIEGLRFGYGWRRDGTGSAKVDQLAAALTLRGAEAEGRRYVAGDTFVGAWLGIHNMLSSSSFYSDENDTTRTDITVVPASLAVGVGIGRILPANLPVALTRVELALRSRGVLAAAIPPEIGARIMHAWVALKNELGYNQRAIVTLKILHDANLLTAPVTPGIAYRVEQILTFLQYAELIPRASGMQASVAVRVGRVFGGVDVDGFDALSLDDRENLVLEARATKVFNLSAVTSLVVEPSLGLAPRKQDRRLNTLPALTLVDRGAMRNTQRSGGAVVALLPISYLHQVFDDYQNLRGSLDVHGSAFVAHAPDEDLLLNVKVGGSYTYFLEAAKAYALGVDLLLGAQDGDFVQALYLTASVMFGTGDAHYVAPTEIVDEVPFDMSFLPKP